MHPDTLRLVQESWARLSENRDALARQFYENLFDLAPEARALFAHTNFDTQREKLVQMLGDVVRMMDDPERCIPELAALGRRHVGYGAAAGHYDAVGAALLAALEQSLGDEFTPRVRDAWMETYRMIAAIMRRAASRLPGTLTGEMPAVPQ